MKLIDMTEDKNFKKKQRWILNCQTLTNNFKFSESTLDSLFQYFEYLAEMGKLLSLKSIDMQLKLLVGLSDEIQVKIIDETILHNWINLSYKVDEYKAIKDTPARTGRSERYDKSKITYDGELF